MKVAWWGKALGLAVVGLGLVVVLARIDWLVNERQQRQREAQAEVSEATAGSQLLGAPYLRRECTESWTTVEQVDDERGRRELRKREQLIHTVRAPAQQLSIRGQLEPQVLERGLFKVNTYNARLALQARWEGGALHFTSTKPGAQVLCRPAALVLQVSDARGLRSVALQLNGQALTARPGALEPKAAGLHAPLDEALLAAGELALEAQLELLGTEALHIQPAAAQVAATLDSAWPHPSFQGRFLPIDRTVSDQGFSAQWRLTELASNAAATLRAGEASGDAFGVALFDPVNPYSLSDRALKYGFLFIALTLAAVLLAELLGLGHHAVHPVQYAFVALAMALFFLLLLALSEHLSFGVAYALAALACTGLLAQYASSLFGHWRAGTAFGAALVGIYGVLYLLLTLEKSALLVGALLLFALLAAAMRATRHVNWYGLSPGSAAPAS